jgi:hypothetical protein
VAEPQKLPPFRDFDLFYVADFSKPVIDLYFRWGDFYTQILKHFAQEPFQLRPADIRMENAGNTTLADFLLACHLRNFGIALRYRIGSVEVFVREREVSTNPELLGAFLKASLGAVQAVDKDAIPRLQTVTATGHFEVQGPTPIRTRIANLGGTVPPGATPMSVLGVALAGDLGAGANAAIRIEPSLKYSDRDCGFVRLDCDFPGATDPFAACSRTEAFFNEAFERLGLAREVASSS